VFQPQHKGIEVLCYSGISHGAGFVFDDEARFNELSNGLRHHKFTAPKLTDKFGRCPRSIRAAVKQKQRFKRPDGIETAFDHLGELIICQRSCNHRKPFKSPAMVDQPSQVIFAVFYFPMIWVSGFAKHLGQPRTKAA
jgi:hypothetical protein